MNSNDNQGEAKKRPGCIGFIVGAIGVALLSLLSTLLIVLFVPQLLTDRYGQYRDWSFSSWYLLHLSSAMAFGGLLGLGLEAVLPDLRARRRAAGLHCLMVGVCMFLFFSRSAWEVLQAIRGKASLNSETLILYGTEGIPLFLTCLLMLWGFLLMLRNLKRT